MLLAYIIDLDDEEFNELNRRIEEVSESRCPQ